MAKLTVLLSKDFRREGQSLSDFVTELKQLTSKDKEDFRRWYTEAGVEVDPD